jgi:hypothetical protein
MPFQKSFIVSVLRSPDAEGTGGIVKDGTAAVEAKPIPVDSLASVTASMSRFLAVLAAAPVFKEGKLGLGDWLALNTLSQAKDGKGMSPGKLRRSLGVSGPRAKQIVSVLERAKAVAVNREGAKPTLSVSVEGKQILAGVNAQITAALVSTNARSVSRMSKTLRVLGQSFLPTDKAPKAKKKAKEG